MGKRANHEGTIYKDRTHGLWYGALAVGGRRKKTAGYRTQREAKDALAELRRNLAGVLDVGTFATLADYLTHWLETAVKPNRKPRTYDAYKASVDRYIVPNLGRHKLTDLSPMHVAAAQNALLRDLAPSTVNNHFRAVLRRALNQAQRWGLVARNVVGLVDPPRVRARKVTSLSVADARRFLAAVDGHRLACLYRLALSLGLRRGELLALTWRDFSPKAQTLTIRATTDAQRRTSDTKSAAGNRVLELSASLVVALQAHREAQRHEALGDHWHEHGLIFPSEVGTPLGARNLYRHFRQTCDRLESFPCITFHGLRHACAGFMLSDGAGLEVVKQQLGHSSIKVTSDTYGHLLPGVLREATGRVDNMLAG